MGHASRAQALTSSINVSNIKVSKYQVSRIQVTSKCTPPSIHPHLDMDTRRCTSLPPAFVITRVILQTCTTVGTWFVHMRLGIGS